VSASLMKKPPPFEEQSRVSLYDFFRIFALTPRDGFSSRDAITFFPLLRACQKTYTTFFPMPPFLSFFLPLPFSTRLNGFWYLLKKFYWNSCGTPPPLIPFCNVVSILFYFAARRFENVARASDSASTSAFFPFVFLSPFFAPLKPACYSCPGREPWQSSEMFFLHLLLPLCRELLPFFSRLIFLDGGFFPFATRRIGRSVAGHGASLFLPMASCFFPPQSFLFTPACFNRATAP